METFISTNGRIRRTTYGLRMLALAIPMAIFNVALNQSNDEGMLLPALLVFLIFGSLQIIQAVKRFHDLNMSGWYWLVCLIPLVNLGMGLYLLFADGTAGNNDYGPDPKGRTNSVHDAKRIEEQTINA